MRHIADTTGRRTATLFVPLFAAVLLLSACGGGSGFDDAKLTVAPDAQAPLQISTRSVPMGHANASYPSTQLVATGSTFGVSWALVDGNLPSGVFLTSAGQLAGTPTETGLFEFTVKATADNREDTQTLLLSIDAFGVVANGGLHFGEAWAGNAVTLTAAGASGPVDYEILDDETQGHLSAGSYVPGSAGGMDATVTLRATDRNTGAQAEISLVVQPDPAAGHVARFGATDVWFLDFETKRGVHAYTTDTHACLAEIGLRGHGSVGSMGMQADQLADFLARRAVLQELNRYYLRNTDGTAGVEGMGISFPMTRPDGQYAAPTASSSLPGSSTRYSIISVDNTANTAGHLGAAIVDGTSNPNHLNNSAGGSLGELGIFVNSICENIRDAYRLSERELMAAPIDEDDLPILRNLLHGQDVSHLGSRAADIEYTLHAFGRSIAAVAAHEIAHSCGLGHNQPARTGALMNYGTTVHPRATYRFLPENLDTLRAVLPGPGRYGASQSKATRATLAAQAEFLGSRGLCRCGSN